MKQPVEFFNGLLKPPVSRFFVDSSAAGAGCIYLAKTAEFLILQIAPGKAARL